MSEWWTYRAEDFLLFSPRVYWRMFELHNAALWPLQVLALAAGLIIMLLVARWPKSSARWLALLLAVLWIFVGWSFLWNRYADINWAAAYVAPAFALEGVLFLICGPLLNGLAFDRRGLAGGLRRARAASQACTRPTSVLTIVCTTWSCTVKISASARSNFSAQTWFPVSESISCAVMRMRSPMRRTLPSTMNRTFNSRATWRRSTATPR